MAETASQRAALEAALCDYARPDRRPHARAFLEALAVDELLFLAEFLGTSILITSALRLPVWDVLGQGGHARRRHFGRMRPPLREDADHKLILVSEFAARCGFSVRV